MQKGLFGIGRWSEVAQIPRILGIGLGILGGVLVVPSTACAETPVCGSGVSPFILEKAKASVVRIGLTDANGGFVRGTGFVWDSVGHIITNSHVATSGIKLTIETSSGAKLSAKVVADFPEFDILVLYADSHNMSPATVSLGKIGVGTEVFTFGNAMKNKLSVTGGLILDVERSVVLMPGVPLTGLMKTDFVVKPGNSGGALFNCGGRVVGVISAVGTGQGGLILQNTYAIPISVVANLVKNLAGNNCNLNEVATLVDVSTLVGVKMTIDSDKHILIQDVASGSVAERAGIMSGDRLTHINGISVFDKGIAESLMANGEIGNGLTFSISRRGSKLEITVTKSGNQL